MSNYYLEVKKQYMSRTGKRLDYRSLRDINEKLHWLSRYWQNPLVVKCADKYLVREYVKDCGYGEILVPLIGVFDNANEIDFEALPTRFVLKCNHGFAYNILCKDKAQLDKEKTIIQLNNWLLEDFGKKTYQKHYSKITPKIICEEFLDFSDQKSLIDYKIHCINGNPMFFLICNDRNHDTQQVSLNSYSLEWERLSLLKREGKENIPRPNCLQEMINYAKILSQPFPYVRADFYYVNDRIYFGELTFTPARCMMTYYKDSTLKMMGEKLKLPPKYKEVSTSDGCI